MWLRWPSGCSATRCGPCREVRWRKERGCDFIDPRSSDDAASAPGARYAYQAPRLTAYGPLNDADQGRVGTLEEADCIPGNPPGCNPDPTKRRP